MKLSTFSNRVMFMFVILSSLFWNTSVFAAPEKKVEKTQNLVIGQVIWTKGKVTAAQPNQAARNLQRKSALYERDVIKTDEASSGQIAFTDSSVVTLRESSELKIDAYRYNKDSPSEDKAVMSIVKGGFRTITGAIPKANPDAYQVNTPVATIGVRGTQYSTFISPKKGLLLKIDKGKIEVANDAGKILLEKCNSQGGNCQRYAVVSSFTIPPSPVSTMPVEFKAEPPLTPVSATTVNSISSSSDTGAGPTGGPGGGGGSTGGGSSDSNTIDMTPSPKTVSSFCVGMLHDIVKHTPLDQYLC